MKMKVFTVMYPGVNRMQYAHVYAKTSKQAIGMVANMYYVKKGACTVIAN